MEWLRHVIHPREHRRDVKWQADHEQQEMREKKEFLQQQHEYLDRMEDEIAVMMREKEPKPRGTK